MEERLIELETKIAFHDKTIDELNEVLVKQQRQIDKLERACSSLATQLETLTGTRAEKVPSAY